MNFSCSVKHKIDRIKQIWYIEWRKCPSIWSSPLWIISRPKRRKLMGGYFFYSLLFKVGEYCYNCGNYCGNAGYQWNNYFYSHRQASQNQISVKTDWVWEITACSGISYILNITYFNKFAKWFCCMGSRFSSGGLLFLEVMRCYALACVLCFNSEHFFCKQLDGTLLQ